jgi:hypothetical protein
MRRGQPRELLLGGLLALASCGGGSSSAPISLDDFQTQFLAAYCKLLVACASMPDQATCVASQQEVHGYYATLDQDVDAGTVTFDSAQARHCIDLLARLPSCKQSQAGAALAQFDDDCHALFSGTVPTGGACFFSEECASGHCSPTDTYCSRTAQCCPGVCADVTAQIPVGGDCTNLVSGQDCANGSSCAPGPNQTFVCTAASTTEGASCATYDGCRSPLFCDLDLTTGVGTCKRPVATGGACNPTASRACDDGRDICDFDTGTCTRKGAVGAPCLTETCVGWASCDGTTCVARPRAGETCDPVLGPACIGGLSCDSTMTCSLTPVGDACS